MFAISAHEKAKQKLYYRYIYMYFQAFPQSSVERVRAESAGGVEIHIQCNRGTSQKLSSLVSNAIDYELNFCLYAVFAKSFFQLQDSCLADCKFLLVKTQFCRTVLYVIIVILEFFDGRLSDRMKYFVSQ